MELNKILDLIDKIKLVSNIQKEFDYIGYEIPKSAKNGNSLVISDISAGGLCNGTDFLQLRIIGKADGTATKIKYLTDLLNSNILSFHKFGFSKIIFKDESNIIFNSDDRFERVLTYQIY